MPVNYSQNPWLGLNDIDQQLLLAGDPSAVVQPGPAPDPNAPLSMAQSVMQQQKQNAAPSAIDPTQLRSGMSIEKRGAPGEVIDDNSYQKILDQINRTGTVGLDAQRAGLKDQQNRIDQWQNKKPDLDLTGLMMASDAFGGTNFTGSYKRPMSEDDRQMLIDKLTNETQKSKQQLSDDEVKLLTSQLHGKYLLDSIKEKRALADSMGGGKQDDKTAQAYMKAMNIDLQSQRTGVGRANQNDKSAQVVEGFFHQYPNLDQVPPKQVAELAAAVDQLISRGQSTVAGREGIIPKSFQGDVNEFLNYLRNNPGGAEQGKFIENMKHLVERERAIAADQINDYYDKTSSSWGVTDWAKKRPDQYNPITDKYRGNWDQKANVFKPTGPEGFKEGDEKYAKDGELVVRQKDGTWIPKSSIPGKRR
jgi:hypothetical protein